MMELLLIVVVAFTITNIDDMLVLGMFFSGKFKQRHIIIGQFIGISVLTGLSIAFALAATWLIARFDGTGVAVGFLGIFPIILGVKGLYDFFFPNLYGERGNIPTEGGESWKEISSVAGITIVNGADNVASYTPLFASQTITEITMTVTVFMVMTTLWCVIGYSVSRLTKHLGFDQVISSAHMFLPFVLIFLGGWVFYKNGTLAWLLHFLV